jgi:hypothetical protein
MGNSAEHFISDCLIYDIVFSNDRYFKATHRLHVQLWWWRQGYLYLSTLFFSVALRPNAGHILILEVSKLHTTTQHSRYDSSRQMISSSQKPLPDNTQETNIHAPGRIQTHDLSRRAAADLRFRPRGHWDRLPTHLHSVINTKITIPQ